MRKLILAVALFASTAAHADLWLTTTKHPGDAEVWNKSTGWYTGNDLYSWRTTNWAGVAGFVTGVASVLEASNAVPVCTGKDVTAQQLVDVVLAYLVAHPETRDRGAMELTARALATAFPCKST
jgi:hypothetical protein